LLNSRYEVLEEYYDFTHGRPFQVCTNASLKYWKEYLQVALPSSPIPEQRETGCRFHRGVYVNEIIAQGTSVGTLYPDAKTVIEIGGEDSKLITLERIRKMVMPGWLILR